MTGWSKRRQSGGRRASVLVCVALAGLLLLWSGSAAAQGLPPGEYQIKAAFLLSFAKFVEWPAGKFHSDQDALQICVIGEDPFGKDLDETVAGKAVNGRPVAVHRMREASRARECHVAFVGLAQPQEFREALQTLNGAGVLTVGESDAFRGADGIINFVLEQNRVRFEINPAAANRAGLKISSKLLSLARLVHLPRPGS